MKIQNLKTMNYSYDYLYNNESGFNLSYEWKNSIRNKLFELNYEGDSVTIEEPSEYENLEGVRLFPVYDEDGEFLFNFRGDTAEIC